MKSVLREFIHEVVSGTMRGGRRMDAPGNLRYGVPVRPNGNKRLWEEDADETSDLPKAVCCLIVGKDGKVLAVSRRNDPTDFGLPGGKVDPGETLEQAAARELVEETGLNAVRLKKFFTASDGEYVTTTFVCEASGQINTDEEGLVRWVTPEVLCAGCFGDYNEKLFAKLGYDTKSFSSGRTQA